MKCSPWVKLARWSKSRDSIKKGHSSSCPLLSSFLNMAAREGASGKSIRTCLLLVSHVFEESTVVQSESKPHPLLQSPEHSHVQIPRQIRRCQQEYMGVCFCESVHLLIFVVSCFGLMCGSYWVKSLKMITWMSSSVFILRLPSCSLPSVLLWLIIDLRWYI